MELELGLALPIYPPNGFDLNCRSNEIEGAVKMKRNFGEAFEEESVVEVPEKVSLLIWNNQPNDEDDHPARLGNNYSPSKKNGGDCIVGWPPLNSWRKNICDWNVGRRSDCQLAVVNRPLSGSRGSNSNMYVKVKMEGVGLTRKVDLNLYHSYQTLRETLMGMFGKCPRGVKDYILTYQDREGDWLVAGNVPWRKFTRSVQRLKLSRRHY